MWSGVLETGGSDTLRLLNAYKSKKITKNHYAKKKAAPTSFSIGEISTIFLSTYVAK